MKTEELNTRVDDGDEQLTIGQVNRHVERCQLQPQEPNNDSQEWEERESKLSVDDEVKVLWANYRQAETTRQRRVCRGRYSCW